MKKQSSGFTLIEILVVISIIGLIASIALASLKSARQKALDTKIVSEMLQLRTQAEYHYETLGSYGKLCTESDDPAFFALLAQIGSLVGFINTYCGEGLNDWTVQVQTVSQPGYFFCIDNEDSRSPRTFAGTIPDQASGVNTCP